MVRKSQRTEHGDLFSKIRKAKPQADMGFHTLESTAIEDMQSINRPTEEMA
jgi:hypothetical protein